MNCLAGIESCTDPQKEMCCPSTKTAITMTVHDLADTRESSFQQTGNHIILRTLFRVLSSQMVKYFFQHDYCSHLCNVYQHM
uniref:Uncharacterized protein n=1 Tax=Xenopus tropicalis TaxID=8364 RepID=A0A1B8YA39_XENTR